MRMSNEIASTKKGESNVFYYWCLFTESNIKKPVWGYKKWGFKAPYEFIELTTLTRIVILQSISLMILIPCPLLLKLFALLKPLPHPSPRKQNGWIFLFSFFFKTFASSLTPFWRRPRWCVTGPAAFWDTCITTPWRLQAQHTQWLGGGIYPCICTFIQLMKKNFCIFLLLYVFLLYNCLYL